MTRSGWVALGLAGVGLFVLLLFVHLRRRDSDLGLDAERAKTLELDSVIADLDSRLEELSILNEQSPKMLVALNTVRATVHAEGDSELSTDSRVAPTQRSGLGSDESEVVERLLRVDPHERRRLLADLSRGQVVRALRKARGDKFRVNDDDNEGPMTSQGPGRMTTSGHGTVAVEQYVRDHDAELAREADAVVAIFRKDQVTTTDLQATVRLARLDKLCPTERYYRAPTGGHCSGFLVGTQRVVTAAHCIEDAGVDDLRFVFGYMEERVHDNSLVVPASEVYSARKLVAAVSSPDRSAPFPEWALILLDRSVGNHTPLPVRRSGRIGDADPVHVFGHPSGRPLTFDVLKFVTDSDPVRYFIVNTDTFVGSSGSPIIGDKTCRARQLMSV